MRVGRALAIASSAIAILFALLLLVTSQERISRGDEVSAGAKAVTSDCRVPNALYDTGEWKLANELDNADRDVEGCELISNAVEDPGAITAEASATQPGMLRHSVWVPESIGHVATKAAEDVEIQKQQSEALEASELAHGGHRLEK
jgi:hypothetical protein